MALRSEIERALDELISYEEGMRFQGIAVILAKQKWPDLIASERKKDLGRDAYAPSFLANDGRGRALASSLTATIGKIKGDLERMRQAISDLSFLIFYTPRSVTEETKQRWKKTIQDDYGIELVVISREDVIADLMSANNASICEGVLGIPLSHEPALVDILDKTRAAVSEVLASWVRGSRLSGTPLIELTAVQLDDQGEKTRTLIAMEEVETALLESQRVVIEGPAGTGKTTTLIQLANRAASADSRHIAFLINLPEFLSSRDSLLDFIAKIPAFLSRRLSTADLAKVYENTHCFFLLNGWNEISDTRSEDAVNAITQIERNFPAAGIILATRTHHVSPPLAATLRVRLAPLSRAQRADYLRQILGENASELLVQLESDSALDELTRVPLIMAQVAELFRAGNPVPRTKMAVLHAVVGLIEESVEHQDHLRRSPLAGSAAEYLLEVAKRATDQGEVIMSEASARAAIHDVSNRLCSASQIAVLPEPAGILSLLCAHHVLERMEYPSISFRFQHQQFQEFFAAVALSRELQTASLNRDAAPPPSTFARTFIDRPAWEEPLRMLSEELGQKIARQSDNQSLEDAKHLVSLTLAVDPVFAADLSRLCGERLWEEVRDPMCERLRLWIADSESHHQQCALAAILASGAANFSDVLVPLLTHQDRQVRLRTYRTWREFHLSSLGPSWHDIVRAWHEDCRADFVGELGRQRHAAEFILRFALEDPSRKVRVSAAEALFFAGTPESLRQALNGLDNDSFQDLVRKGMMDDPPTDLRPRVIAAYIALLGTTQAPLARIGIMLSMAELGETQSSDDLFAELTRIPIAISHEQHSSIQFIVERLHKIDREKVGQWVADRIISGSLSGSNWIAFAASLSDSQRQLLLEQFTRRELTPIETHRLIDLAAVADSDLCRQLFSEACIISLRLQALGLDAEERRRLAGIIRQIQDFLRKAPPHIVFAGIFAAISDEPIPTEYEFFAETFGSAGDEDFDLTARLNDQLRARARAYLLAGVPWVLRQNDYFGNLKAIVATTLARIGDPGDIQVLRDLIQADINRRRVGLEARLKQNRGPIGEGATTSYANWHVRAVRQFGFEVARPLLIELLNEQEYEQEAARGLLLLARASAAASHHAIPLKPRDYARIWVARAEREPSGFNEERRRQSVDAIRKRILELLSGGGVTDSRPLKFRAKKLAPILAILDPKNSAELVLQTLASESQWDEWDRMHALQAILFGGGELTTEQTLEILQPVIEHGTGIVYDHQGSHLLSQCLSILAFVDEPTAGIARISEALSARVLRGFELRDLIAALGYSRSPQALGLLVDIATRSSAALQGAAVDWINSLKTLGTHEARQVLLNFVDPDIPGADVQYHFEYHEIEVLAAGIAESAQADATIMEGLFSLSFGNLDADRRAILVQALVVIGTQDALIASLNTIRDDAVPPIPFQLIRALEALFLEHRPYGNSPYTYTLEPRAAEPIRRHLFEMLLNDNHRKISAWSMLGQIELWRIEYGRPSSEPRHPNFDSGLSWPPLGILQHRNGASSGS